MSQPIIVIGGGHNGLTAATYLTKTRRPIILVEARETLGGLAASEEFHPGYFSAGLLNDTSAVRPWVVKELGLAKYGLNFEDRPTMTLASADRDPFYIDKAGLSGPISDTLQTQYAQFTAFIDRIRPTLLKLLDTTPLEPLGPLLPLLGPALNIRRLGAADLTELIRVPPMCAADWMRDSFDDERLGSALVQGGLIGTWAGPWSPWSAANVLLHQVVGRQPISGGAPALIRALEGASKSAGVDIRTGVEVTRIVVESNRVVAAELSTGERIETDLVCSTVDPVRTGLNLIGQRFLSARFAESLARIRTRGTTAFLELALNGHPVDQLGKPVQSLRMCRPLDDTEKAFDPVKYDQMSDDPLIDVRVFGPQNGASCPDGHTVMSISVHYAPYALAGGWTEEARSTLMTRVMSQLGAACPGISDFIVGHRLTSPADLADTYRLTGGHVFHGEHAPDQLLFMRPTIDTSQYKTPVTGLYMGGSGSHPGGGLTCAPGALCAKAMMR